MDDKGIFQGQAESKLSELDAQIERLKADKDVASSDVKLKYKKQFEEISWKREKADNRLREFDLAGGESWRVFAPGVTDAIDALQSSVADVMERLS